MIASSEELVVGQTAPAFSLPAATGGIRSLSELRGSPVVLFFYPAAFTPGCTTEACDFRDNLGSFQGAGYAVLGISPDPVSRLVEFAEAERLGFPLFSDEGSVVARDWGAWGQKTMNGRTFDGPIRTTAVVDADGRVAAVEYNVDPEGHVARLRESLGL